jgi:TfoX/Sxy family transcriptional regulator of competence genes
MKYQLNPLFETHFKDFILHIQEYFKNNNQTVHKARNELKIIPHAGVETLVKSFKIPNLINKIAYTFFRDSKAKKSYAYSLKLGDFTPAPIGYIEFFQNGLLAESYFVSERFDYDFTIREPLLDTEFPNREAIFKAFAHFTLQLHNAGIFHEDYSPGNILVKEQNGTYIFKVVDVNRMKFFQLSCEERAKNFSKLWASEDALTTIAAEYTKEYEKCEDFVQKALHYSLQNKKIKNFKKRLKGKEIDW